MINEYKVQKVSQNDVARATQVLNERGADGWRVIYITPYSQDLIVVMTRRKKEEEKKTPAKRKRGRPKQKTE